MRIFADKKIVIHILYTSSNMQVSDQKKKSITWKEEVTKKYPAKTEISYKQRERGMRKKLVVKKDISY